MSDTTAAPDAAPQHPTELIENETGVAAEYVDPEPDEEATGPDGGDLVQLTRTGWVRLVIAGHGRVRFRPPRFGELRHIMQAYEQMIDEVQERSHTVQALAENLDAEIADKLGTEHASDPKLNPEERHKLLADVTLRSRRAGRELTAWREDQYLQWWTMVHGGDDSGGFSGLGVSGETMPAMADMPVWLAAPALAASALQHWQAVPLDRGRR